jgi:hypothetical protein
MALSDKEKETIKIQIDELETQISNQEFSGESIDQTLKDLKAADIINRKEWTKYHLYITNYEREIEGLIGEYVVSPIAEQDIEKHADSTGRLYQNPEGTETKKIPQYFGSPTKGGRVHELDNKQSIIDATDLIRNGTGNSGSSENLAKAYTAGDSKIYFQDTISTGWILVEGRTLLKITGGTAGGECSNPTYTDQASCTSNMGTWSTYNVYNVVDRINDQSFSSGDTASPNWGGFTDLERLNKDANNNNQQGMLNEMVQKIEDELNQWKTTIQQKVLAPAQKNEAGNFDASSITEHQNAIAYIDNYLLTTPVQDGDPGLDGLLTQVNSRDSYRLQRAEDCKTAKSEYYPQRKNFSDARGDVQSGTLKRIKFLTEAKQKGGFKPGGTEQQQSQLKVLKNLLAEE